MVPSDTDDYQVQQKQILISLYFAIGEENWNHKYDFIYHQICTNERGKDQKQDYEVASNYVMMTCKLQNFFLVSLRKM